MKWDWDQPNTLNILVQAEDMDKLGHANNAVYVRWLEQCAWKHSESLGLGLAEYRELDRAMVVLKHEIDYLAAAYCGDELLVATWITHWDRKLRLTRHFQLCRRSDQLTLLRARSTFVCVALSSGKPKRMPPIFAERYGSALILPSVSGDENPH